MNLRKTRRIIVVFLTFALTLCFAATALAFDKVIYANADPFMYYVQVDVVNNIVTVFSKDSKGKYSKIHKQFICTVGASGTPTPTGTFRLNESRRRFGYFQEFGVYAQYWTNVAGGIYFHSILYTRPKEGSFTRTSYNNLGRGGSHGCIRLLVEDARWIYYNCPSGTRGEIVKGEKNDTLRKSLLPKVSASKYKPEADQYENAKRNLPRATIKSDTVFKAVSGKTSTIQKGATVNIISSGQVSCRVTVNGVEGHIDSRYLNFIPNGPGDAEKNQTKKTIKVFEVSAAQTNFYERATPSATVLGVYGKGTELSYVGETKSFYKVKIEGVIGYIYKKDIKSMYAERDPGYKPKVYKVLKSDTSDDFVDLADDATPTPTPTPEPTDDEGWVEIE